MHHRFTNTPTPNPRRRGDGDSDVTSAWGQTAPFRALRALATMVALLSLTLMSFSTGAAAAATRRPALLTLTSPAQVTRGGHVQLYGNLVDRFSRRPIGSGRVTLYYARPGSSTWTALETVRSNSQGSYQGGFTLNSNDYFAARFAGTGAYAPTWSATRLIKAAPADGTKWWGSDGCHYYEANGSTYGDYCVAYQTDSAGNAIKTIYNVYRFDKSYKNNAGPLMFQLNTAYPNWLVWRVPSDPNFKLIYWAAVPRNNINAEPHFQVMLGGQLQWTTVEKLQAYVASLQQGTTSGSTNIVTIGGSSESYQGFTDLVNGVDRLGGNTQLGQAFSNIYSLGISDPVTMGVCGEYSWTCSPL